MAPWTIARDENKKRELNLRIYHAAESIRIAGILLQPFIPAKAAQMLDRLGVAPERRTFAHARLGADFEYGFDGAPINDPAWREWRVVFPPLPVTD